MSLETDDLPPAAPRFGPLPVRPFYWSVRRELWEHPAVWMVPAAVAALTVLGFVLGSAGLAGRVRAATGGDPAALHRLMLPYAVAAAASLVSAALAGAYYSLVSLQGERRDRSLLFWKSLPVADRTAVLAKAAVPLLVQPVVVLAVTVAAHLAMLAWGTIVLPLAGVDPRLLWIHAFPGFMWVVMAYSLPFLALWHAPVVAYLMLVSAWARRAPFLWTVVPPVMLGILERMVFSSHHVFDLIRDRLVGGMVRTMGVGGGGRTPLRTLGDIDIARVLGAPGLWIGLVVAALMLAAAIRLRRRLEPN